MFRWPGHSPGCLVVFGVMGLGALAMYWDAYHFEPYYPRIYPVTLHLPRLSRQLDGVRPILLADLHIVRVGPRERRMIALVEQAPVDMIVMVGDYIEDDGVTPGPQTPAACTRELEKVLTQFPAGLPKVACLGNWDMKPVAEVLRRCGFQLVEDGPQLVRCRDRQLVFVSLSDLASRSAEALRTEADSIVVLSHVPEAADEAARLGADLVLGGHWHGGQVCLPFVGTLGAETARYPLGAYTIGQTRLYVTRGVGFHTQPVRFFCRSEVTLITLKTDNEAEHHSCNRPGDAHTGRARRRVTSGSRAH